MMIERIDATPFDPEQFVADLKATADLIDAPFREDTIRESLRVFEDEFRGCVVQLKATCKSDSGVYYRFFYKWDRDLTTIAQNQGLLPIHSGPIVELQRQVLTRFPNATRAGLDFDTSFGLAKEWTFTGGPTRIEELVALPAIPESVNQHLQFFNRHRLRNVFFVASDFQQNSMNVYFGLDDDCRNETWIRSLAEETGGTPEDDEVYAKMLASLAVSTGVGTTFRWDTPEMGRWCLYGLNVPFGNFSVGQDLPELPERLRRFQQLSPTLNESPQYNIAWSFGQAGFYTKLEKSYARDADHFLTCEMGGNLNHPSKVV